MTLVDLEGHFCRLEPFYDMLTREQEWTHGF